jgi:hypothetical protein
MLSFVEDTIVTGRVAQDDFSIVLFSLFALAGTPP